MQKRTIEEAARAVENLPPLEGTYAELWRMRSDPGVSARDVAAVVERDPSLAADLLKLVNSAFYGLRAQVEDVGRVVALLGVRQVCETAFSLSLYALFDPDLSCYGTDARRLAEAAFKARKAAETLAPAAGADPSAVALPALLMNVGRLLYADLVPPQNRDEFARAVKEEGPRRAEIGFFGRPAEAASAAMLRAWGVDASVVEAIAAAEAPRTPEAKTLRLASAAVLPSAEPVPPEALAPLAAKLGLETKILDALKTLR